MTGLLPCCLKVSVEGGTRVEASLDLSVSDGFLDVIRLRYGGDKLIVSELGRKKEAMGSEMRAININNL